MRWIVFDKDGLTAKCEVRSLQYSGEFMGACSITAKVVSPNPVDFEIGDYLLYRGERFEINYDPTVLKQASSGSYGEGFVYDNIVFNSLSDELTRCDFLDYVPNDNNLHYSSLPNFSFFADSVQKLAERIQVNLDRIYTGDKQWTVNVNTEKTGKTDVNVVINNQTCWDALALVKSEFGLNFIIRGRTITIGTEGIAVGKVFSYGKGNGLISVERNAESDQKVITRLRAYGSTKNMPESYYKNVGLQVFGELIWRMFANTFYLNIPYEAKLFIKSSERGKEVVFKVNGEESTGYVTEHTATDEFEGCCELHFDSSELASKLQEGMKVYFIAYINKTEFPRANKEYAENVPNNMAVRHLMLPSFPTETTDPYIDSENIGELGIREATVFFDGSNGNEEIYPSMEGMTAEDLKAAGVECAAEGALDEVVSAEQIEDEGFFKEGSTIETFKITLKDVGFNINDHLSVSGNATIAFNTGMCGGRDFEIVECKKEGANYVLTCNRHYDESLDLYFPYKDYQIKSGDKFVLINIEMPDVYVQAASQRLLTAAKWYLGNNDYVRYSYVPRIDNIFLAREHDEAVKNGEASIHDTIKEGDLMLFHDTDLGIEGSVIIDTLSIREGESLIPEYEVTLRNNKTVGTITKIQNQIDSIVSGKTGTGGGYNAAQIKSLIDSYGQTLFLSKTKDDRSKGKIASDKAIEVGNYVSGASGAIIYKDAENGQTVAEFDKLYVRMKAYFETLEIINVNTIGGKQIISPAGSVRCIGVEETDNAYRCYFLAEQDGEKVQNRFLVYDQIYSQMFDAVEGTSQNVSTHYFWRLCIAKSKEPVTFENKSCHYIDLSKTDCDKDSDVPMVGDVLNQRGNRTDLDRMNFIEMSSVDAFSPNITLFHGVNSYSLDGKAYVSYGVDKSTNKAFMDVYGDMYVGDRQNTSYMRYTQENGLEISGTLSIGTKLGDTPLKDLISASSPEGYQEFVEKVTQDIEGLQAQIDGAIESYFFQYDPTLGNYPASEWITEEQKKAHLNDTFTNVSEDSGHSWRWSLVGTTYNWVEIKDTATAKALQVAGQAKDTADGKRRVFVDTPYPPYDKGDLWSRGSDYPLMVCVNTKDKNGVYNVSDFDYADNNAKLKEEMQILVGETKDELNNAIGQAKNEAVNNANAYTDQGKQALQESIDALEQSKANLDAVYTKAEADGKISKVEEDAINAAKAEADAAIAVSETIIKAYADGVVDKEEAARIKQAQENLEEAKKYAEEQAQKAIDEANDTYGYLAKALGTEVDGGLLLTSLIQMRDTDQNIMSGINGLTAKGDKSIATWWGGGMYDMFDYYDWDGAKWVAKKNIQIPSNVPSGVIRMDGTGYLAKGKFWWDESGKIYADPTALFLMFDVEDESASLSQTILAMRDKQTEFADMWEFKTDANGRKYLLSKYPLVTQEGITMYSGVGTTIPSIYDGLPIDGTTIYWENGILKAQGGGNDGINEEQLAEYLTTNNYAKKSDIPSLSGYATQTWVASQGYITGITSTMVTSALGFTPYNANNFTKANIKSTLGISDWALDESKPSYTYTEIGGTPDLSVYALKTSLSSYQPLISTTNKLAYSLISGTPTSLKNPTSLTFGSKTYDGSEAKTINASDLGALTSHQTIYALTLQAGTFSADTYTPNSGVKTINIPTTTAHISESGNLYFTNARAVSALSSTLASYVTLGGSQTITGAKNFTGGLSVNGGSLIYNSSEGYWKLEGNLLVTGGVAMYSDGSDIGGGGTSGGGSIDYPLKWSGFSSGSYDGSSSQTIYIPSKLSELTNDSGYALSSALSGYLPLSGGTLTSTSDTPLVLKRNATNSTVLLSFNNNTEVLGNIGIMGQSNHNMYKQPIFTDNVNVYKIYHSGNFNPSDYLPKSGGTISGILNISSISTNRANLNLVSLADVPNDLYFGSNGEQHWSLTSRDSSAENYFGLYCALSGVWVFNVYKSGALDFKINPVVNGSHVLHAGNYSSYALPLTGGELSDALSIKKTSNDSLPLLTIEKGGAYDSRITLKNTIDTFSLVAHQSGDAYVTLKGAHSLVFETKNTERMRISDTGGVTITSTLNTPLSVKTSHSDASISLTRNSNDTAWLIYNDTGWRVSNSGWMNSYALIHSGNISSQNVASATKLENNDSYTAWGQTFFVNGKPNSLDGTAYFHNGDLIYAKDEGGTSRYVLGFTSSLSLGYGSAGAGYDTYILGKNIHFRYSNSRITGLTLNSSGNVGIGITNPEHKLHVEGDARINGSIYGATAVVSNDTNGYFVGNRKQGMGASDGGLLLYTYGNSPISIFTGGGERMHIKSDGNVGIGTTSPDYKLVVNGSAQFGTNTGCDIWLNRTDGFNYINARHSLAITTGNNSGNIRLTIGQDGTLSAGATTLSSTLSVTGATTLSSTLSVTGASTFTEKVSVGSDQALYSASRAQFSVVTAADDAGMIWLGASGIKKWGLESRGSSDNYAFRIYSWQSNAHLFHMSHNGDVGIGATNPSYKLHVSGSLGATSGSFSSTLSVTSTSTFTGKTTHNGGISATSGSFSTTLAVTGVTSLGNELAIASDYKIYWHSDKNNYYISSPLTTSSAVLEYMGYGGHRFKGGGVSISNTLSVSSTSTFTGKTTHNGGISSTTGSFSSALTASSTLSVSSTSTFTGKTTHNGGLESTVSSAYAIYGNSSTSRVCIAGDNGKSLYIASKGNSADYYLVSVNYGQTTLGSGGSNAFTIRGDGNVGIGQNAPSAKLHVAGNILTSGSITMNSMRSMKNIINENGLSLEELSAIKPTRFTWKDGRDNRIHVGGIADDVMKVLPEVVFKGSDGVLSMDYASAAFVMAASLIQPMTEHERRIANLERENALLKEEIRNLKSA